MTKNGTIQWRIEQLEKNYSSLDSKIDSILNNHLPHIQGEIARLHEEVSINKWKIGAIVGTFSAAASMVGGIILNKIL